jgi:hypothetical protein
MNNMKNYDEIMEFVLNVGSDSTEVFGGVKKLKKKLHISINMMVMELADRYFFVKIK